ncbi:hypothetical protein [Spirosoma jeollabukense]
MEAMQVLAKFKHKFFEYRNIMDRGLTLYFVINAGIRDKEKNRADEDLF